MNNSEALNRTLFLQINGGDGTPAWLIHAAIGIADYQSIVCGGGVING